MAEVRRVAILVAGVMLLWTGLLVVGWLMAPDWIKYKILVFLTGPVHDVPMF